MGFRSSARRDEGWVQPLRARGAHPGCPRRDGSTSQDRRSRRTLGWVPRGSRTSWASLSTLTVLVLGAAAWSASTAPKAASFAPGVAASTSAPTTVLPTALPATTIATPPPLPPQETAPTTAPLPTSTGPPTSATLAPPRPCTASRFAVRVSTDHASFPTGGSVEITMTISNGGPTCSGVEGSGPCDAGATVANESGQVVWVSNLGPYGCPALIIQSVPSDWSDATQLTWAEDECPALGGQCTHAQVPPGMYSLVGSWTVGETASKSRPLSITIASS